MRTPNGSRPFNIPVKVEHESLEALGEEVQVSLSLHGSCRVHLPDCPGMQRRAQIAQIKFTVRDLPTGCHQPLAQQERQLLFGKTEIHLGKGNCVKCQVPGGKLQGRNFNTSNANDSKLQSPFMQGI